MTVGLKGFQFTHLFSSIKSVFIKPKKGDGITPFQAVSAALGGSVGTANIAGVAGAIVLGGPGAVFWMWVSAFAGMASKFCETFLAVKYRGGAMRYIELGLGKKFKPLSYAFSVFGALASLIGTALVQSNTTALFSLEAARFFGIGLKRTPLLLFFGVLTALFASLVILGGAKRVARFSERAVPFMALAYAAASLAVIIMNRERLLPALESIFFSAFGIKPVSGCFAGLGIKKALRVGVARGVYSNEAGVGSSPMAHALSNDNDPVKHGMLGIFEVFADTIVICTLTALVILTSGIAIPYGESGVSGAGLVSSAFAGLFGRSSSIFISVSVLLFAFTSITGWSLYGENCVKFIFGERSVTAYRIVYVLLMPLGAVIPTDAVWRMGESFNYLMALPNLLALVLLLKEVKEGVREYKTFEKRL